MIRLTPRSKRHLMAKGWGWVTLSDRKTKPMLYFLHTNRTLGLKFDKRFFF